MRQAAVDAGRDPDAIEITTGTRPDADTVRMLGELGVSRVVVPPLAMHPKKLGDAMAKFADEVIAKV
jgi:2-methylisocitrate lyase-like PEP mutase family enzyme